MRPSSLAERCYNFKTQSDAIVAGCSCTMSTMLG
jgi:hypothetical protein